MLNSKSLLLSYGGDIIFYNEVMHELLETQESESYRYCRYVLFFHMTNARSSGVRKLAVSGKSTTTEVSIQLLVRLRV
jgi:hypothetical protein